MRDFKVGKSVKSRRTLSQQVSQISAGVTALVLGVTLFFVVFFSQQLALEQSIEQTRIVTRVIGSNVTASIAFRDPATAGELLDALAVSPEIVRARVYLADGTLFAEYNSVIDQSAISQTQNSLGETVAWSSLVEEIKAPILLGNTQIGSMSVWLDSSKYQYRVYLALLFSFVIWLIGAAIAYVLAQRLNVRVTKPLNDLSEMMMKVSAEEDYSPRFKREETNEIAMLGGSFNQMLEQIEDRELRLQEAIKALELARDAAEEAARSKSSFLANMSHEIRTPMNGVVGMIALLKRTELSDQQQLYFDTIDKSAISLLMIIDDILDFTKIEAGRLEVKSESMSLKENLASIATFFDEPARLKGITFNIDGPKNVPDIFMGDSGRLRQVLLNLLGNAMKFTKQGAIQLNIAVVGSNLIKRIRFEINDTGIGIAPKDQQRIFSEFFQADATSTRQFGGTGLGLAICKQLVTLMGGSIGFQSTKGIGSTFWFELPFQAPVLNPFEQTGKLSVDEPVNPFARSGQSDLLPLNGFVDESLTSINKTKGEQPTPVFKANILVAEDSEVNQFIIRELLATFGLKPTIVNNGQEAVESFESNPYDLIFMDIQMPIMDGVLATRTIRNLQSEHGVNPKCDVVGLSAHAMSGDRERYLREGMNEYLTKPISITELGKVLENLLRPVDELVLWR